jgi:hypothetical protein
MIGTPQDPRELAEKLGVDLDNLTTAKAKSKAETNKGNKAETNGQARTNGQPQAARVDLGGCPRVLKALELVTVRRDGSTDRSVDAHRVARACFDAGLTAHASEAVMRTRSDLGDWLDENPANEVARSWSKFERDDEATQFDKDVAWEINRLRVRAEAKRRFTIEQQGDAPPFDDGLLSDILERPEEPPYRIDRLMPSNGATLR